MIQSHRHTLLATRAISDKKYLVAALLSLFLGFTGADRFYVRKYWTGLAKLLTLGGVGVWWVIDIILVYMGAFKDSDGRRLLYRENHFTPSLAILGSVALLLIAVPLSSSLTNFTNNGTEARTTTLESGQVGSTVKKEENTSDQTTAAQTQQPASVQSSPAVTEQTQTGAQTGPTLSVPKVTPSAPNVSTPPTVVDTTTPAETEDEKNDEPTIPIVDPLIDGLTDTVEDATKILHSALQRVIPS